MNDLFWIILLGNFAEVLQGLGCILAIACIVGCVIYLLERSERELFNSKPISAAKEKLLKKYFYTGVILSITFLTVGTLAPDKKDLLLIYGVGGTIAYLKENDTAKQLPEKTLKCLDKFMNEYIEEKDETK